MRHALRRSVGFRRWAIVGLGLLAMLVLAGLGRPQVARAATNRYANVASDSDTGDCSLAAAPCKTIGYAITQAAAGA